MVPSLLILTDFFQAANGALNYATNLAVPLGARLVLLHVCRDSKRRSKTAAGNSWRVRLTVECQGSSSSTS
jgi:nucleotide-binding universal stress UspA family protein